MNPDPLEILSAFVDGEAAHPEVLAQALATPGARDALIGFVQVRAALALDASVPSRKFYAATERALHGRGPRSGKLRPIAAGLAAAALVGVGLLTGFAIRDRGEGVRGEIVPPTPTREIRFDEGVDWFKRS